MKVCWIILLTFAFKSVAQDTEGAKVLFGDKVLVVKTVLEGSEGGAVTSLKDSKNSTIFSVKHAPSEGFLRINIHGHLGFIVFALGAHGEKVFVVDIEERRIIFKQSSSWPVSVVRKGDTAKLTWWRVSEDVDNPDEFSKVFKLRGPLARPLGKRRHRGNRQAGPPSVGV